MRKKNQKPKSDKVTHMARSLPLNERKLTHIQVKTKAIGNFTSNLWQEYGSIKGIETNFLDVRKRYVANHFVIEVSSQSLNNPEKTDPYREKAGIQAIKRNEKIAKEKADLTEHEQIEKEYQLQIKQFKEDIKTGNYDKSYPIKLTTNYYKETLDDALGNIHATYESAKEKVEREIYRKFTGKHNQQYRLWLIYLLDSNKWQQVEWLKKKLRKYWKHGINRTFNQLIVRSEDYKIVKTNNGKTTCILIPCLFSQKLMAIPMKGNPVIPKNSRLRIILKGNIAEVHFAVNEKPNPKPCGKEELGADAGYTEVLFGSNGKSYGDGLGAHATAFSDKRSKKHKARQHLAEIAKKKPQVIKNNLGTKKKDKELEAFQKTSKTMIYNAVNSIIDEAGLLVVENLTRPMKGKSLGKKMNRRLNSWQKGVISEAIQKTARQRGSLVKQVNPAYTSQIDSQTGYLLKGARDGDLFYCESGEVLHADLNAARNILARYYDTEIESWMSPSQVHQILLERLANRSRALVPNLPLLDSSCNISCEILSTESELSDAYI